jgi:hypothetical protein
LSGQALELLELALVKLESSDTEKLTHGSGFQTFASVSNMDLMVVLVGPLSNPDVQNIFARQHPFSAH